MIIGKTKARRNKDVVKATKVFGRLHFQMLLRNDIDILLSDFLFFLSFFLYYCEEGEVELGNL